MDSSAATARECGWCRISYDFWKAIRCIETTDDLVFCSAICLEQWEAHTGRSAEILSELPFIWNRELIA